MTRVSRLSIDSGLAPAPGRGLTLAVVLAAEEVGSGLVPASAELPGIDLRLYAGNAAELDATSEPVAGADVLLIQVDPDDERACATLAALSAATEGRRVVVAGVRGLGLSDTRKLMRLGVADVLPLPATVEDLQGVIDHGRQLLARAPTGGRRGRTIAFAKAVGGVGATALLTQCGALLAESGGSVCLLDLDVQFGSAAVYLDLRAELGLADLITAGDRLDGALLRSVATQHRSKLNVVAAPPEIMPLDKLTPEGVAHLIEVARAEFDTVLIDLPGAWTSWSLSVLSQADDPCFVTSLTVPSIRQVRRQLDMLEQENVLRHEPRIVANRVERTWFKTLSLADTEQALHRRIDFTVANDFPTVSAAIDQGRLLAEIKAASRVQRDIEAMAKALVPQGAAKA